MHQSTTVLIIHHTDDSFSSQQGKNNNINNTKPPNISSSWLGFDSDEEDNSSNKEAKKLADRLGGQVPVGWCRDVNLPPLLSVYQRTQRSREQKERQLPTIVVFRNYLDRDVEEAVYTFPLNSNVGGGGDDSVD